MSLPRSVVPLESNPEVFTQFAQGLGLTPSYSFHDIYSLTEPDLMAFLPRPMKAIILLFPINEVYESTKDDVDQEQGASEGNTPPTWFKQTVRNACGLYAVLHSLSNNPDVLDKESILKQFLLKNQRAANKYADDQTDDFIVSISDLYNKSSSDGQTAAPGADEEVNLHFITYVQYNGQLFEMDGRRSGGSKSLGPSSSDDLLDEPLLKERVQWYIDNAGEQLKLSFSLLGLGPSWD